MTSRFRVFSHISFFLAILAACTLLYLSTVFTLVAVGNNLSVSKEKHILLDTAYLLAPNNPFVIESKAIHLRAFAVGQDDPQNRKRIMEIVLGLYEKAIEQRPLWPYYQIAVLDAEYLLGVEVRERFEYIIRNFPNERGLDSSLLEIALLSWDQLSLKQRLWVNDRLRSTQYNTKLLIQSRMGEFVSIHPNLCFELHWSYVKAVCKQK